MYSAWVSQGKNYYKLRDRTASLTKNRKGRGTDSLEGPRNGLGPKCCSTRWCPKLFLNKKFCNNLMFISKDTANTGIQAN